jgi:hypothetical protein
MGRIDTDNIGFIVSSVINFSPKKLSYSPKRSIYTPEERTDQTIKSIKSIQRPFPNAKIILIEMGFSSKLSKELIKEVDEYIFVGNNFWVRKACDSKFKGLGEVIGLLVAYSHIPRKLAYYFKISGRYFLTDDFDISKWNNNKITLKMYGRSMSTRLYGFSGSCSIDWKLAMMKSVPRLLLGDSIENVLISHFPKNKIEMVASLGVSGQIATDGSLIKE